MSSGPALRAHRAIGSGTIWKAPTIFFKLAGKSETFCARHTPVIACVDVGPVRACWWKCVRPGLSARTQPVPPRHNWADAPLGRQASAAILPSLYEACARHAALTRPKDCRRIGQGITAGELRELRLEATRRPHCLCEIMAITAVKEAQSQAGASRTAGESPDQVDSMSKQ